MTVAAHMLYDIVRKLPDGAQLELDQGPDTGRVAIKAGRSRFALQALPPEDFPDLNAGDLANRFTLKASELKGLVEKTRFAISTEETRYYLNGIYLHEVSSNQTLRAVATDGHRLARAQGDDGEVEVALSASKIRFSFNGLTLTSKLIDGTFPDYERVIPRNNDKTLDVDTKLFSSAVDRVSTISFEKGRAVKLNVGDGRVVLTVNNPDSGSAEEEIAASYDADPIDIGFNSRYLLDIASQIKSDTARFQLADAGSPTIVLDPSDEQALYVLMPMRV